MRAASAATGDIHDTHLPAPLADDGEAWTALVALMLPDVARLDINRPDGAMQWLVHPDGSWSYHQISARIIEQGGPRRLWTEVEDLYSRWVAHIGVTITPTGQRVWLNDPNEIFG